MDVAKETRDFSELLGSGHKLLAIRPYSSDFQSGDFALIGWVKIVDNTMKDGNLVDIISHEPRLFTVRDMFETYGIGKIIGAALVIKQTELGAYMVIAQDTEHEYTEDVRIPF